jgi:hypothetical protein
MYIPASIKSIDSGDKSTTIVFDVAGREVVFTYSNHQSESQGVYSKLTKFGSRNSYQALKSLTELIGLDGEVNLIEVKTAFGYMPAITDFR